MDVEYTERGQGWRPRGRPRQKVPDALIEILMRTYDEQTQAEVSIAGESVADVRQAVRLLRRGAAELGKKLRVNRDRASQKLRFYVEDIEDGQE